MWVAGTNTDKDWFALQAQLESKPTTALWEAAYEKFYKLRIETRYLKPMAAIKAIDADEGEGFAIAALFCTLIEFLETCEQGHNFKSNADPALTATKFEYRSRQGRGYFESFLRDREPFKTRFPSALIGEFYTHVRCGLLHEAKTEGGWVVVTLPSGGALVSEVGGKKRLFRDELKPALEEYFENYRKRLIADPAPLLHSETQKAFIRKFAHLFSS